jgi:hypothetical protein
MPSDLACPDGALDGFEMRPMGKNDQKTTRKKSKIL